MKVVVGERVAFSAYGLVRNLAGSPISTGNVVAKHGETVEQATIQTDGSFRVLGL